MTKSFPPEYQLKAFINAAQYFAGLTSGQDIWEEAAKVLVKFFGADIAAFGAQCPDGEIELRYRAFSVRGTAVELPEADMMSAAGDVFESGFLTFISISAADPIAVSFFPIMHNNRVIAVMVAGHLSVTALAKETLDLYLALAGLIGATYSRKISETAVLQAKEDWERTFEAVPDMIALLDTKFRIIRANRAMADRLGKTAVECVGLTCYNAVHGTDEAPPYCPYRQVLADGREHAVEMREDRLCGDFLMSATPLLGKDGRLLGGVIVARDITSIKETEERLRQNDRIMMHQSRQATMGEMINNIAHQWRQPLNVLGILIQKMQLFYDMGQFSKDFLDSSVDKSMDLINHMSQTIDDFRNFFKSDKEMVEFTLREAVENTLSLVEDSFKSMQIGIDFHASANPVIIGFPNEYSQVLLNILMNARDALSEKRPDDPKVTVNISMEGVGAVVTISDNAGGIPEDIMDKIFEPYFTTKGPDMGTGVGLFMSKTIIEKNMNGRLTARNTAEGAEFRIEL